jgi:hypothetical protein
MNRDVGYSLYLVTASSSHLETGRKGLRGNRETLRVRHSKVNQPNVTRICVVASLTRLGGVIDLILQYCKTARRYPPDLILQRPVSLTSSLHFFNGSFRGGVQGLILVLQINNCCLEIKDKSS